MREIKFRAWDNNHQAMHYSKDAGMDQLFDWVERHGGAVMQYTGLKDKDGKEVYEGDIVRADIDTRDYIYEAIWHFHGFYFRRINGKKYVGHIAREQPVEIIGNIYENPELLGG